MCGGELLAISLAVLSISVASLVALPLLKKKDESLRPVAK